MEGFSWKINELINIRKCFKLEGLSLVSHPQLEPRVTVGGF